MHTQNRTPLMRILRREWARNSMTQPTVLPPGTILQLMHVRERLKRIKPGVFVEVGPGAGEITALLLELGWRGTAFDLSTQTIESLQIRFSDAIRTGNLVVAEADFCTLVLEPQSVDLVISSMVIEHLDDPNEAQYFEKARACLTASGVAIHLVPAHMRYWGIEDDIAGHFRRYSYASTQDLAVRLGWQIEHMSGLTFPLSNLLLPLSNRQVKQHEADKLALTYLDRTKDTGHRNVPYKTSFPPYYRYVMNAYMLFPFYVLQKMFAQTSRAMVLYVELKPLHPS